MSVPREKLAYIIMKSETLTVGESTRAVVICRLSEAVFCGKKIVDSAA